MKKLCIIIYEDVCGMEWDVESNLQNIHAVAMIILISIIHTIYICIYVYIRTHRTVHSTRSIHFPMFHVVYVYAIIMLAIICANSREHC